MSSACSVPAATATAHTLAPASGDLELRRSSAHPATPPSPGPISYEGRVSVLAPNVAADPSFHFRPAAAFMNLPQQPNGRSASEFDEAVLRRIKAECDNMLDINGLHKDDGYQSGFLDMGNLPVYSGRTGSGVGMPFPPHFNAQANALSQYYTPPHPQRSPEVPVKQERRSPVNDYLGGEHSDHHEDQPSRARHDDSGVSPGTSGSDCVDPGEGKEAMVRGESSSPFSESGQYSNDDRPSASVLEEDEDVMDEDDEDMDGAEVATVSGSDLVGDALSRLQRALQSNGVLRSGREASSPGAEGPDGEGSSSQEVFQCHLCSYSGTSRFHFQAHINTHFDVKCSHCDFTARTEGKLRAHMKSAHGVMPEEGDESTLRVPRVNAQGKVKTFKCKQCNFVAVTKLDFWEHSRTHIKAEKLLTCPKCPFVTEYKHHLEYHMRNHFGSKPFKCPKCSYSCVNKSMLNSHMKSHSNVYQYRCADCAYATKYCHSLKLHLRKYGHTPAVAISGDGPGRGSPMMEGSVTSSGRKSSKKRGDSDSRHSRDHPSSSPMSGQGLPSAGPVPPAGFLGLPNPFGGPQGLPYGFPLSLLANGYPGHPLLNGMGSAPSVEESKLVEENTEVSAPKKSRRDPSPQRTSSPLKCNICDFSSTHKETFSQHLLAHAAVENRDLAHLFGVNADNLEAESKNSSTPAPVASLPGPSPSSVSARSSPQAPQVNDYISRMFTNPLLFAPGIVPGMVSHNSLLQPRLPIKEKEDNEPARSPASSPAQSPPATPKETRDEGEHQRSSTVPLDLSRERDDQAPTSGKNRRKGQAFKLERIAVRLQERRSPAPGSVNSSPSDHRGDEEETDDMDNESQYSSRRASFGSGLTKPSRGTSEAIQEPSSPNEWTGAYQCSYCDIAFKDPVMYTMHMGYHGYKDPFKCNMCGQQTNDKLAFFLHIARSSHV